MFFYRQKQLDINRIVQSGGQQRNKDANSRIVLLNRVNEIFARVNQPREVNTE